MNIDAVVFDIGNVLVEWHPERFYDRMIGADRRRALFDSVDLDGMNRRVDMGEGFRDVIYGVADAHPTYGDEIRLWHDHWIEICAPEIPLSVHLLRALRAKGVPVFALTNFGVESFAHAQTEYPFLTEFDAAYVSGQMQMMKPAPEIYAAVEAGSGIAPERLLFADDRPENVEAARARGWHAHLFEGPEGWGETLVGHGLLAATEARL